VGYVEGSAAVDHTNGADTRKPKIKRRVEKEKK
jgi:hypothetical protein